MRRCPTTRCRGGRWMRPGGCAARPGHAYRYRLEMLLVGGGSRAEETGPIESGFRVTRLTWGALAPNPSQQSLQAELMIPRAGLLQVRVYDVAGHVVAIVFRG